MRRVLLLALLVTACTTSSPAPVSYGGSRAPVRVTHASGPASHPRASAPQTYTTPQPNWAEGEGTPLSAFATQPAQDFDPLHPPRTHRVAPHESLADIATHYQVPVLALIEQNHLEPPYRPRPGAEIELPPPNVHRVTAGETLQSIADRNNVQAHSLAVMNRLQPPYDMHEGDEVVLPAMAGAWTNAPPPPAATLTRSSPATRHDVSAPRGTSVPITPEAAGPAPHFAWPVHGDVLARFGAQADGRQLDGVEIAAQEGAPVGAAADGDVVYAGTDLPSYGTLVLIRHGDGYVTAYGYARRALVREGQHVRAGETIAEAGRIGQGPVRLLFQVRHGREAVDPTPLLGN